MTVTTMIVPSREDGREDGIRFVSWTFTPYLSASGTIGHVGSHVGHVGSEPLKGGLSERPLADAPRRKQSYLGAGTL